jgi:hypothetical protein
MLVIEIGELRWHTHTQSDVTTRPPPSTFSTQHRTAIDASNAVEKNGTHCYSRRPGSSVGIATDYGLDGPGIESRWGARFSARPDRPWVPPSLLYNGYRTASFPGGKVRPGRDADRSSPSSAEVLEE